MEPAHRTREAKGGNTITGTVINGGINVSVPKGTSPADADAIARATVRALDQRTDRRMLVHERQRLAMG